jgi:hypothetical protein
MKDLNYVIGRLQGLNELVRILKDLVDKKEAQNSEIVAVVTDHVADQLSAILGEFDSLEIEPHHREALSQLKEQHSESNASPKRSIIDQSTVHEDDTTPEEEPEGDDDSEDSPKEKLEKHEKTVDDLLRDLESMKN